MYLQKEWYAVYTRPGWEKKVAGLLGRKGIEHFCPVNKVVQQVAKKKVFTEETLITSFVFIRIAKSEQREVRKIEGVMNFVYWLTEPAVIKNDDIETLKMFMINYNNVQLEKLVITANTQSKAADGSCSSKDQQPETRGNVIRVPLTSMGYALVATIQNAQTEKAADRYPVKNRYVRFLRLYKSV